LIVLNWLGLIGALRSGRGYSFVPPVVCGLACAAACLVCPEPRVRSLAWLPLVLDLSIAVWPVLLLSHVVARAAGLSSPFDPKPPEA
jgi:hypothetical protein